MPSRPRPAGTTTQRRCQPVRRPRPASSLWDAASRLPKIGRSAVPSRSSRCSASVEVLRPVEV